MSESLVRLEPAQELLIERLTRSGIYKTKSEVIRAGIMELAKENSVFTSVKELEDELVARKMLQISDEVKRGKRKLFSESEIKKKYDFQ